jgi:hypothetical protein
MGGRNEVLNKDSLTRTIVEATNTLLNSNSNIDANCNTSHKNSNRNRIVKEAVATAATAATTAIATTTRVSSLPSVAFPQKNSASKILHTALPSATKNVTKKTFYVSKLPEHLFLHLKRFEFSYTAMRQVRAE